MVACSLQGYPETQGSTGIAQVPALHALNVSVPLSYRRYTRFEKNDLNDIGATIMIQQKKETPVSFFLNPGSDPVDQIVLEQYRVSVLSF